MLNWYKRLGIECKLLLPTILLVGIVFVVFTNYIITEQRHQSAIELNKKADRTIELLAISITESVWTYDEASVSDVAEAIFSDAAVIEVLVQDNTNKTVIHLKDEIYGTDDIVRTKYVMKSETRIGSIKLILTNYHFESALGHLRDKLTYLSVSVLLILMLVVVAIIRITSTSTMNAKLINQ